MRDSQWCLNHDPDRLTQNRRNSSKGGRRGGRGRPRTELQNIRTQLQALVDAVGDGTTQRADASVMGQLLNYMVKCIQVELTAREQEELVERLEALEEGLERSKGSRYAS